MMRDRSLTDRQKVDAWIEAQKGIFERTVKPACGDIEWDSPVWRLNSLRRSGSVSDTPITINFRQLTSFADSSKSTKKPEIVLARFTDFSKALVIWKADRRNWSVSQVVLDELVLSVGVVVIAALDGACEHPADLVGRNFDELQLIIVDAVDRRTSHVRREGVPESSKVRRFDASGKFHLTERKAYGLSNTITEIAARLDAIRGGAKTIFTRHIKWDNSKLDSRNLERKRQKEALYPDLDALYFLAELAQRAHELKPRDLLILRLVELMLVADKRIGEVLSLPVDALVERNGVLGLRYVPKKDAPPYITWIPFEGDSGKVEAIQRNSTESEENWTAARDMFKRAISDIIEITSASRERADKLEHAKALSDIELPARIDGSAWPIFVDDLEVTGLPEGTRLQDYYNRRELAAIHMLVDTWVEDDDVPLPRIHYVQFRRRNRDEKKPPFVESSWCKAMTSAEQDAALSEYVDMRLATTREIYVNRSTFIREFCGLSYMSDAGDGLRASAMIWWRRYHVKRHPTEDIDVFLRRCEVDAFKINRPRLAIHEDEIRRYIRDMYLSRRIVQKTHDAEGTLTLNNALFCVDDDLLHNAREYFPFVKPLSPNTVRSWLRGSDREKSVFERYGRQDLNALAAHMLRRFNTTELRLAGVSSFYIARNAGRTVRRVDDYDYIENTTLVEVGARLLNTDVILEADYVKAQRAVLEGHAIPFNEIADFITDQLVARNVTEFGSCSHEHSIGACPSFKACYLGCGEFWICKGDAGEVRRHSEDFKQTKSGLLAARAKLGESFYSSHYVIQYGAQLITLRRILDLHVDPSIPDGTMLKPMPEKRVPTAETIRAMLEDDDALESTLSVIADLLTETNK